MKQGIIPLNESVGRAADNLAVAIAADEIKLQEKLDSKEAVTI
jgi:hypothetical protein